MKSRYDPDRHHRRWLRLKGYDYAQVGAYFVTICAHDRAGLFGDVVDGAMHLNDAGHVVQEAWSAIPTHYPGITIDAYVVMPNHIHGIIMIAATPDANMPTVPVGAHFITPNPATPATPGPTHAAGPIGPGAINRAPTSGDRPPRPPTVPVVDATLEPPKPRPPTVPVGARFIAPNPAPNPAPSAATPGATHATGTTGLGAINRAPTGGDPAAIVGAQFIAPARPNDRGANHSQSAHYAGALGRGRVNVGAMNRAPTIGNIVRAFKARVTVALNRRRGTTGVPIWQRDFYEHIIRDDDALDRVRHYIIANPARWAHDPENPSAIGGTR